MSSAWLRVVRREIRSLADPVRAVAVARYFKTARGEYGYGDRFLGLTVPATRSVARTARDLSIDDALALLRSKWHEERTLALFVLSERHRRGTSAERTRIHRAYLAATRYINNWDLVDLSAPEIVGTHIARRGMRFLEALARSESLWERRIAVLATFRGIADGDFGPALRIGHLLIDDDHDLIHKAVGWMLREVGKRSLAAEKKFLDAHAATMPRTALRYAIERFPAAERARYLGMRGAAATSKVTARSAKRATPRRGRSTG